MNNTTPWTTAVVLFNVSTTNFYTEEKERNGFSRTAAVSQCRRHHLPPRYNAVKPSNSLESLIGMEGMYEKRHFSWMHWNRFEFSCSSYQAYVMGVAVVAILLCLFISGARSVRKRRMMMLRERQRRGKKGNITSVYRVWYAEQKSDARGSRSSWWCVKRVILLPFNGKWVFAPWLATCRSIKIAFPADALKTADILKRVQNEILSVMQHYTTSWGWDRNTRTFKCWHSVFEWRSRRTAALKRM